MWVVSMRVRRLYAVVVVILIVVVAVAVVHLVVRFVGTCDVLPEFVIPSVSSTVIRNHM